MIKKDKTRKKRKKRLKENDGKVESKESDMEKEHA
jgi:hypothetical protein